MKRYNLKILIALTFYLLSFISCQHNRTDSNNNTSPSFQLPAEGNENTLEIATWNLKNFPEHGKSSIEYISTIIKQLDIDIYAIQEIENVYYFNQLVNELPEYKGLYSDDKYNSGEYQKTGIIYKKNIVSIQSKEMLFTDNTYAFPRPPMLLNIKVEKQGSYFDFYLIVIHLKAYGEPENIERRRAAAVALKNYMDIKISDESEYEKDYIVAGDWNDEIDDAPSSNAFQIFINVPNNYKFLTMELADDPKNASYPLQSSLIDHILISKDCFFEYNGGKTKTLRLDDYVTKYFYYVSDHRPVVSIFPVFE